MRKGHKKSNTKQNKRYNNQALKPVKRRQARGIVIRHQIGKKTQ